MRPLILLDIDGVCSPMCPADHLDSTWAPWRRAACGWNKGWVSATLGQELSALTAHADVWWCSGWEDEAPLYGAELGAPDWPYVPLLTTPDAGMFKLASVIAQVGERPVWWWDDEHNTASTAWASTRTDAGIPTIAAHINDRHGLRADDIAAARHWAHALGQADVLTRPRPDPSG